MFLDKTSYPFLSLIDEQIDEISRELSDALERDEVIKQTLFAAFEDIDHYTGYWVKENGFHADQIGYDIRQGEYAALPLFKLGFPIKSYDVEKHFPNTMALIKTLPGVQFSGFVRIAPGAVLLPHTHTRSHLIYHVLTNDLTNGKCLMQCGNEQIALSRKGDSCLFDYSIEHSSINESESQRINFILDFIPLKDDC